MLIKELNSVTPTFAGTEKGVSGTAYLKQQESTGIQHLKPFPISDKTSDHTPVSVIVKLVWLFTQWEKRAECSFICCNIHMYSVKQVFYNLFFFKFCQVFAYLDMFYYLGHQSKILSRLKAMELVVWMILSLSGLAFISRTWLGKKVGVQGTWNAGLILGLSPANEKRRCKVTPSLIGWAQT